jgi:uncharacterized protein YciI
VPDPADFAGHDGLAGTTGAIAGGERIMKGSREFLYRLMPTRVEMLTEGPDGDESAVLERHAAYVADLARQGIVRLAGRTQTTDPNTFGIVVFWASDESEAGRIMNEDPAVKGAVMSAELFPFKTAFTGSGRGS